MFSIISSIQNILSKQKNKKLIDLKYKDLFYHERPTELEKKILFDYFSYIDPPPSNDSSKTKEELYEVQELSSARTESGTNTILTIDKDPLIIFKHFLNRNNLVFEELEFSRLYSILYEIILDVKYYYNRPRPNQIAEFYDINIDVLHTKTHDTPSYPSGHVAYAALAYEICSEKYPHLEMKFKDMLNKVSRARIVQGVHFKSDNDASIDFVHSIYNILKQIIEESNHE
jgi:hypothetical protein